MNRSIVPQSSTLSRKQQTTWLIILTAMTLMPSYALQGWLASGHSATELPFWFWIAETISWSLRALIEAAAILFLFQTATQTLSQARLLWGFKIALILLITLTLGPVVASTGLKLPLTEALPRPLFWLWSFAIASYAPLMLGAVGVAYRIMPTELEQARPPVEIAPVKLEQPVPLVTVTEKPPIPKEKESHSPPDAVTAAKHFNPAPAALEELTPLPEWDYHDLSPQQAQLVYWMLKNQHQLTDARIAQLMNCSRTTIIKIKQDEAVTATNGRLS